MILDAIKRNKPFLGICLGLQLLFERSEESTGTKGLGIFRGDVIRFRIPRISFLKVPHMGWNTVDYGPASKTCVLSGIRQRSYFYFVHSYYVRLSGPDSDAVAAACEYGETFPAAIEKENIHATQFHPEKSQRWGLKLLENFASKL